MKKVRLLLVMLCVIVATIGLSCEAEEPVETESLNHGGKGDGKLGDD